MVETIGRNKYGVPQWNGEAGCFQEYEDQALQWEQSVEYSKRYLCGPRLVQELGGPARRYVMGKRPDWLSFPGGVQHLMDFLRRSLGRPLLPELSEYLNVYFKQSKRKKFETMNQYIVRKTEAYQRAKQSLARVLPHGSSTSTTTSSRREDRSWRRWGTEWWTRDDWSTNEQGYDDQREDEGFEDAEEEEHPDGESAPPSGWSDRWTSHTRYYPNEEDEAWTRDTPDLLPDFLQGWYLLMDSNLSLAERNMIQTAVQGDFKMDRIARELRAQWPEEDLRQHDQGFKQAGFWQEEVYEEPDWTGDADTYDSLEQDGMNEEGLSLVAEAEQLAEEAMATIEKAKITLREARAKQHQVKMNRQYYQFTTGKGKGSGKGKTIKCFKCGGNHKLVDCPDRHAPKTQGQVHFGQTEVAPFVCYTEDAAMMTEGPGHRKTTEEAIAQGYGIIDGGATKTLGSIHALEAVAENNMRKHQDNHVLEVDTTTRPTFGFGNSSRNQCASTAKLKIQAGGKTGHLQVHALEEGQGPILLSISTLRTLKAVIDFENDLIVLRALDPKRAIKAERSQAGHQLLPLTDDLYSNSVPCHTAVPSLMAFC